MEPTDIYALMQRACIELEAIDEYAIAAHLSHCMAALSDRFGVGQDHLELAFAALLA